MGGLALAGVAFATTGPSAVVAFGLNGAIAFLTAASFARLARRFTDSGGLYLYARKLLSIEVAFVVGRVVWFAAILAGVLYALGFAAFALEGLGRGLETLGRSGEWTQAPAPALAVAVAATAFYTAALARSTRGRGTVATVGNRTLEAAGIGAAARDAVTAGPFVPGR